MPLGLKSQRLCRWYILSCCLAPSRTLKDFESEDWAPAVRRTASNLMQNVFSSVMLFTSGLNPNRTHCFTCSCVIRCVDVCISQCEDVTDGRSVTRSVSAKRASQSKILHLHVVAGAH